MPGRYVALQRAVNVGGTGTLAINDLVRAENSPPASRAARCGLPLRPFIRNAPDRAAGVVGGEQRGVLGHRERGRPAPPLGAPDAGGPEAGGKILVASFGAPILERYAHHLVARRLRSVP